MVNLIKFQRIPRITTFLDPRQNYEETHIESEIRVDPLTGFSGRIAHFGAGPRPTIDFQELVSQSLSKGPCPFCPDLVTRVTPKFPPALYPAGRLVQGESIVFPNLSPYDAFSAVGVITKKHALLPGEFTQRQWIDALFVAIEYFRAVHRMEKSIGYGLIGSNYMPMAGASLLHPHLQIYATERPGNFLAPEISASQQYFSTTKHLYWEDLIAQEQAEGSRYLGRTGTVHWLCPFVPLSFIGDVEAIFPDRYTILDLTPDDLGGFTDGLTRILRYMSESRLYAFNLAFYPGQGQNDRLWVHARISFRGTINPLLNSPDVSAIRQLYDEPFTTVYPEDLAQEIRPYFGADPATSQ